MKLKDIKTITNNFTDISSFLNIISKRLSSSTVSKFPSEYKKIYYLHFANIKHNKKYNYSKIEWNDNLKSNDKVIIICPIHGEFEQKLSNHINGKGCKKCANDLLSSIYSNNNDDFIAMANKVHNNKYNYSKTDYHGNHDKVIIICPIHGEFEQTPNNHIHKLKGCKKCGYEKTSEKLSLSYDKFIDRAIKIHGNEYDYSKSIIKSSYEEIEIICKKHGSFFQKPINHYNGYGCSKCSSNTSKQELELLSYIKSIYDNEIIKYRDRKYEIDIFIPELSLGFEYNGSYYHSTNAIYGKTKKYHQDKSIYFNKLGIKLIHIWDFNWFNQKNLIKSMIKNQLGKSKRIFARKCIISHDIDNTKEFFNENHLFGYGSPYMRFTNLIYGDEIVISIKYRLINNYIEIDRLATKSGFVIVGGFSKLLKDIRSKHNKIEIRSYSDMDLNNDYKNSVYYKNGFLFDGITEPSMFYVDNLTKTKINRQSLQKHKLLNKFPNDKNLSGKEIIHKHYDYLEINNSGNFRFKLKGKNDENN